MKESRVGNTQSFIADHQATKMLNGFVIGGMAQDVPLATIYWGILPFLAAQIVLLVLWTLWPDMARLLLSSMR